jgi:hypothetical protein
MLDDPIQTILFVARTLEELNIQYLIGGSLASSIHGMARATRDVDIVADIREGEVEDFASTLKDQFYVDTEMIRDAIKRKTSFNIIHLESMFKVDIYILKQDAFSREEFKRRSKITVNPDSGETAYILSPEDAILSKLLWFQMGGEVSDRQWSDVVGMLNVQKGRLDMKYLIYWARELNITELFKRSLKETGSDT